MPNFNLSIPADNDFAPVITDELPKPVALSRQERETMMEDAFGPLKPVAQFMNVLASPSVKDQIFAGPINAVSKFGNAIGDLMQGKKVDVSDAWEISEQTARAWNPLNIGMPNRDEFTEADKSGKVVGEVIGAELAGFATTGGVANVAKRTPQIMGLLNKVKQSQTVKNLAVATAADAKLRRTVGVATTAAKGIPGATAAVAYIDPMEGNLLNLGDIAGLELPGRVDETDNYFDALAKNVAIDGFLAPLAIVGAGRFIPGLKQSIANEGAGFFDELAKAELEPYLFQPPTDPSRALPPARHDSAISRALDEQTQIRQVEQQRNRLQDMGLVEQGGGGQLELSMPGVIDPDIKTQIRQLQAVRGQLIKQNADTGADVTEQLGKVDQSIENLMLAGSSAQLPPSATARQLEFDMPDGRPEMDTMLAQLDELDDSALRQMHRDVMAPTRQAETAARMEELQAVVAGNPERLAQIEARLAAGDLTETGAKRLTSKQGKILEQAQLELNEIQARVAEPEVLVGDQLQLQLTTSEQMALDLPVQLKTFDEVAQSKVMSGYKTPGEYRSALEQFPRDVLRQMTAPGQSPRVAALVKARTGRRVWQAKKSDIIDALVELSERENRFLPPEMAQGDLQLTMDRFGPDAPLFAGEPADLGIEGRLVKMVDADGVEQAVPVSDFISRGMDGVTRERLKKEILEQAVRNGEVQPPITPIPKRPILDFEQGDLFAEGGYQLDLLGIEDAPIYKASNKPLSALLEEIRLRYDYHLLDTAANRAQVRALKDALRWDELTWEQKKRIGVTERGVYDTILFNKSIDDSIQAATPSPYATADVPGRVKEDVAGRNKKVWTAQGLVDVGAPLPEPPPAYTWFQRMVGADTAFNEQAGSIRRTLTQKRKGKTPTVASATAEEKAAGRQAARDLRDRRAKVAAELEELQNESKGARC